jgi:glutamate N-acetyltransferase / amino-acid N-acetyltransferase
MNRIASVPGFLFSGIACGVKPSGDLDLALVHMPTGAVLSAVYTTNQVVAAPVVLSRANAHSSHTFALIVNSGNANACTGAQGNFDALEMTTSVATALGLSADTVQVCSTGVIGQSLPMPQIRKGINSALANLSPENLSDFSEAITTTDLYQKAVRSTFEHDEATYTVQGVAKGAGMIAPNMATMLVFVFTDAPIAQSQLDLIWKRICDQTFNAMTVDGDTSTNDTALVLSSGVNVPPLDRRGLDAFERSLLEVCDELAHLIVGDGEGATKAVRIKVAGAHSVDEAKTVANVIARSPLVKTALHGEDPNWGRIIAAAGRSGVTLQPEKLTLSFDDYTLYEAASWCGQAAEKAVHSVMQKPRYTITLNLNCGDACAAVLTCDLTAEYIRINADYRS